MPQEPKRPVSELRPFELRNIVSDIQKLLWQDEFATDRQRSRGGSTSFWDANKKWPDWTLKAIADVLDEHGLKPIEPPTVQGFNTVDEFIEALPKTPPADLDAPDEPDPEDDYGDSEDPDDWIGGPDAAG